MMKTTHAITHPIIYTATRLEAIANRYVFNPMGTTAASMKILGLLRQNGHLTPRRILELGGGTKSNVSQRLDYLEKKGFIVREHASVSEDKRQVIVKLTKAGRGQILKINARLKKAHLRLSRYFTENEIERHTRFFEKINQIIDKEERNLGKIFNCELHGKNNLEQ